VCQAFILKFFSGNPNNFNHLTRCDLSKREANHTALQPAVNCLFHRFRSGPKHFQLFLDSRNLLINKAFIVPTALEVVRIIRGSKTPSTLYFKIISIS